MFLDPLSKQLYKSLYRYTEILNYMYSRKVTDHDIKNYRLGYSPVVSTVKENSVDWHRFQEECWKGKKLENKITFPISDQLGKIVGLSGRSVGTKEFKNFITNEAKYNGFFFGLSQALPSIYKKNYAFVVEGFFDAIALSKAFPNTVASLTAGLMDNQYALLRMYCDTIIVVFDMDKAGNEAKENAIKREGVYSMDIGYKDPARSLELLGVDKFKVFMDKKLESIPGGVLWLK